MPDTLTPAEQKTREGALTWSVGLRDCSAFIAPTRQFVLLYPPSKTEPPRLTLHTAGGESAMDVQDAALVPLWELARGEGNADVAVAVKALQSLRPPDEDATKPPKTRSGSWVYGLLFGK